MHIIYTYIAQAHWLAARAAVQGQGAGALLHQPKALRVLQRRGQALLQPLLARVRRQQQRVEAGVGCWQAIAVAPHPA